MMWEKARAFNLLVLFPSYYHAFSTIGGAIKLAMTFRVIFCRLRHSVDKLLLLEGMFPKKLMLKQ